MLSSCQASFDIYDRGVAQGQGRVKFLDPLGALTTKMATDVVLETTMVKILEIPEFKVTF